MRRDALENRERLLAAANEAFSVHGLDASVEEIAHIAGVGMGTLYRRFPTKESLIDYMVSDLLQQMLTLGEEALKRTDGDGLEYFLRSVASLWESHQGFISRLWSASYASALYKKFDAIIDALVDQAKSAKIVRADLVASDVVVTFWAIRGIIDASHELAPGTWQRHVDIVMAGLALGTQVPSHDALSIAKRRAISATRVRH
jgi:AcrR family transcriptional regulator